MASTITEWAIAILATGGAMIIFSIGAISIIGVIKLWQFFFRN